MAQNAMRYFYFVPEMRGDSCCSHGVRCRMPQRRTVVIRPLNLLSFPAQNKNTAYDFLACDKFTSGLRHYLEPLTRTRKLVACEKVVPCKSPFCFQLRTIQKKKTINQ